MSSGLSAISALRTLSATTSLVSRSRALNRRPWRPLRRGPGFHSAAAWVPGSVRRQCSKAENAPGLPGRIRCSLDELIQRSAFRYHRLGAHRASFRSRSPHAVLRFLPCPSGPTLPRDLAWTFPFPAEPRRTPVEIRIWPGPLRLVMRAARLIASPKRSLPLRKPAAAVDSCADAQHARSSTTLPVLIAEPLLNGDCRAHGQRRLGKLRHDGVTDCLDDRAMEFFNRPGYQIVVTMEQKQPAVSPNLIEVCSGADDVRGRRS